MALFAFFLACIPTLGCWLARRAQRPIILIAISAVMAIILFWAGLGFLLPMPVGYADLPEVLAGTSLAFLGLCFFATMLGGIIGALTKGYSQYGVLMSVYWGAYVVLNLIVIIYGNWN